MACNCGNRSGGNDPTTYVVRFNDGTSGEFNSKVQADIAVTRKGGTIEVKKK